MCNAYALLPKDKFDNSGIEKLKQLTEEEIAPVLPLLLEWLRDYNWPVAREVLPVLAMHQSRLVPTILEILRPEEKDEEWKYWIIALLLPLFSHETIEPILPSVKRIAGNPTLDERSEEVDAAASDFLQNIAVMESEKEK